jgi:nucleotide-binding universal stress UspA family protein
MTMLQPDPIKIERILYATDFSSCARQALPVALSLARAFGAEVRLLHVLIPQQVRLGEEDRGPADPEEVRRRLVTWAQGELDRLIAGVGEPAPRTGKAVREDAYAAPAILDHAAEEGANLIVLGTHGRRGPGRLILGSVAEEVVRRASCPVLTVREGGEAPAARIARILVPIDFSEPSRAALAYARDLAVRLGARLDLLHVVEQVVLPSFYVPGAPAVFPESLDALRGSAEAELRREAEALGLPAAGWEAQVVTATPSFGIVEQAEARKSDLIVMATRGLTGVARLLLGSTAERVVRMAPCPVLTLGGHDSS